MEESVMAVALFGSIAFIVWAVMAYRFKARSRAGEVLERLIDNKEPLTPELVKSISLPPKSPHGDLKWALIFLAIGLSLFFISFSVDDAEGAMIARNFASFPTLIGLALLSFWYMISRHRAE